MRQRKMNELGAELLEQLPVNTTTLQGEKFDFSLRKESNPPATPEWFFHTPVGQVVDVVLLLGILLLPLATTPL